MTTSTRGHTPRESLEKHAKEIIRGQHLAEVLRVTVFARGGKLMIRYRVDKEARRFLIRRV
ncbi:MAG: hypothetical protein AAB276_09475, partial [Pseudomonadota bacterium]